METTPIEIFSKWFSEELNLTKVSVPTACCLSTLATDHYPNTRFVSLKAITENSFKVTGTQTSWTGIENN